MDIISINKYFSQLRLTNIKITKISKIINLVKLKDQISDDIMAIHYIYIENQTDSLTNVFKNKYPRIVNYNNRLMRLKNGEIGIQFAH